ncbi:MAG: 23S rRNA (pseudouridine(1915)-N(3))-methyltransferase RlmH [Gemmatimonadales bacterium]|nr:23S rRNA (pseudouridine(1915)-N(3))-methyltransferase RlmH [Gemmatimonadales bacterium]
MELVLLAVGRLRPYYRQACDDYARRLSRHVTFREVEVREASRAPTEKSQQSEEAERLLAQAPSVGSLVALERSGTAWSSPEVARQLDRWLLSARPVALVLGGSHGLSPTLLARADLQWSLGPLTLPHELARVVVVEQIYRGFSILRGEPYHK